ncbi:MAG: hypothetical protein ACLGG7_07155 [Bacteriovoracia bacterium]
MKETFSALAFIFSATFIGGCTHKHLFSEEQVQKDYPEGIIAELDSVTVSPGDRVDLVRETCRRRMPARGSAMKCTTEKLGGALVITLIDDKHAVIKTDDGVVYEKRLKIRKSP